MYCSGIAMCSTRAAMPPVKHRHSLVTELVACAGKFIANVDTGTGAPGSTKLLPMYQRELFVSQLDEDGNRADLTQT